MSSSSSPDSDSVLDVGWSNASSEAEAAEAGEGGGDSLVRDRGKSF